MKFYVAIMKAPTSKDFELKRVIRGCSTVNEAIEIFMKSEDLYRAHAAYAYPVGQRYEGPSLTDWRNTLRCSVTGKVSMLVGRPSTALENAKSQPDTLSASGF